MISDVMKIIVLIALILGIAINIMTNSKNKKRYYQVVYNEENENFYF